MDELEKLLCKDRFSKFLKWIIKKFYSLQRVMGSFGSTQLPNLLICVEHERELYFWTLQVIVLQGAVCGIHVIWAF